MRCGINQNNRFIVLGERISEVAATNAEIRHTDIARPMFVGKFADHFAAESVVAKKNISQAAY